MSNNLKRVTVAELEQIILRINRMTGSPETSYNRNKEGRLIANIGNFHLEETYGACALRRICDEGGAVYDVLDCGLVSKRELKDHLLAFIKGLEYSAKGSS